MILFCIAIITGFLFMVWGADRFIHGAAAMARNLGVPPMIIGLTIVSLCTSFPEILIAAMAASDGNNNLAIGNALGSNIANIGLVLGCTAMVMPLKVHSHSIRREIPVMFLVMFLALALMLDGTLSFMDGIILLVGLGLTLWWLTVLGLQSRQDPLRDEMNAEMSADASMKASVGWFILGLLVLLISSRLIVWGAVQIALELGVSDLVIGLTIVAIGTSLPELVASIVSVLKNEPDIAIGNIVGSNIFNLLAVLSMPALIYPQAFAADILARDFPVMLAFSVVFFLMAYRFRQAEGQINRVEGGLLLTGFIGYLLFLYVQVQG